ncbi:MAG TPA: helix-turn-helix domain-containing protein [Terriglobia bacterium]|nr:helix-turn-helix domain-containing protein [Terriglobia bacterium]
MSSIHMARFTTPEQGRPETQGGPPTVGLTSPHDMPHTGEDLHSAPHGVERLLTSKEASEVLKIHPKVLERMAKRGEVPALKVGKFWRYRASTLDAWINSRLESGRQPCRMETSF